MPPQNLPQAQNVSRTRARRRRSSCPPFIFVLILLWAFMMVSFNIARVLMLPEIFVRDAPRDAGAAKEPNYYERLGVDPLVSDATLKQLWRNLSLEMHPVSKQFQFPSACATLYLYIYILVVGTRVAALGFEKKKKKKRFSPSIADNIIRLQDKRAHDPEVTAKFVAVREIFDTLMDGRRRCEYDKEHRIRGKWAVQTCHDAFRKEYRELAREEGKRQRKLREERKADGDQGPSAPEDEPAPKAKPVPPGRTWPPGSGSETQQVPIPVGTAEARPEAKGSVAAVTSTAAQAWESFEEFWFWAQSTFVHRCWDVLSIIGISN